jgi:hypothetical protein
MFRPERGIFKLYMSTKTYNFYSQLTLYNYSFIFLCCNCQLYPRSNSVQSDFLVHFCTKCTFSKLSVYKDPLLKSRKSHEPPHDVTLPLIVLRLRHYVTSTRSNKFSTVLTRNLLSLTKPAPACIWNFVMHIHARCSRIGCWGEYLGPRETSNRGMKKTT